MSHFALKYSNTAPNCRVLGAVLEQIQRNPNEPAAFATLTCAAILLTPPPLRCVVTGSAKSLGGGEGGGWKQRKVVGAAAEKGESMGQSIAGEKL